MKNITQSIYQFISALKNGGTSYAQRYVCAFTLVFLLSFFSGQSFAQCCLTDHLIINTGYDPMTGAAATAGAQAGTAQADPHWTICAMDAQLATDVTTSGLIPAVGAADVIVPAPGWAIFPGGAGGPGNWINCFNGYNYTQTTTNNYNWSACRTFTLQCDADVTFNFTNVSQDNWIMGGTVDGWAMPIPLTYYAGGGLCCGGIYVFGGDPGVFLSITSFTHHFTAGVHTISFNIRNDNVGNNNTGFALQGFITTLSPSIVPENVASCTSPTICPVTGPVICVGATTTLSTPVSGGTWTSGNTVVATVDTTGVVTGIGAGTAIITYTLPTGMGCPIYTIITVDSISVITGSNKLCVGAYDTLYATPPGGTWISGNTTVGTIDPMLGIVNGLTAGTTIISYISPCNDTTYDTVNVVCCTPSVITGSNTLCVGAYDTLNVTPTGGTWISGSTAVGTIDPVLGIVNGVGAGTTIISYISPCSDTVYDTINVVCCTSPITGPDTVCRGSVIQLSDSLAGGTWGDPGYETIAYVDQSGAVTGIIPGTVVVTYTLPCGSIVTVTVNVINCPHPCADKSQMFIKSREGQKGCTFTAIANVSTLNIILGYQWSGAGTTVIDHNHTGTDSYTFSLAPGSTVVITCIVYIVDTGFTDTTGPCCQVVLTQTVTCPGIAKPCCFGELSSKLTDTVAADSSGNCIFTAIAYPNMSQQCTFVGYIWNSDSYTSGIVPWNSYTLPPVAPGTSAWVTVTYVAINPLGDTCLYTQMLNLTCDSTIFSTRTTGGTISIFPNPTNEAVTITSSGGGDAAGIDDIQVIDVNGKKVGNYTYTHTKTTTISLKQLPPGTYLLRINKKVSKVVTKVN